jgi:hypothetical protein
MAEIRLAEFEGDTIVVHFGGEDAIDAYTFANALIGFADIAQGVNYTIDPGQEIEIVLEADGRGSFRAVIRRIRKGYGGVLSRAAEAVFWGVVANVIYDATLKKDPPPRVTVKTDEVIVQHGPHTIVVPRAVQEATEHAKRNPAVQEGLRRTFEPLEADEKVTDFGLTRRVDDRVPLVSIPRAEFPLIATSVVALDEMPVSRKRKEIARLVILKAWLNHAKRKWSFEWNGVPISAPIADQKFLDSLERREHLLGAGDALDAEISFVQGFDKSIGVYVTNPKSYVVTRVIKPVPRG